MEREDTKSPDEVWRAKESDKRRANLAEPITALSSSTVAQASSRRHLLRLEHALDAVAKAPLVDTAPAAGMTAAEMERGYPLVVDPMLSPLGYIIQVSHHSPSCGDGRGVSGD